MIRHRNALPSGYRLHWYEIRSVLGQGGFGITYLAHDPNLDQPVAIKEFLPKEYATRGSDSSLRPVSENYSQTVGWGLERFLDEAKTLAKFKHPNIVRVLSVFEANRTAYMVMEYEQGESLEAAVRSGRIGGERSLSPMLGALLDGLELVHAAGFIHRDIKPDNIFLRADGVPVLIDFGSARQAIGVATRTLTTLVSPGYAPFEQYHAGKDVERQGPWTDIYSLAATLHRVVVGVGPPDALSRANAVIDGKRDLYQRLAGSRGQLYSKRFLEAIDEGLELLPEKRPQSVAEWRALFPPVPGAAQEVAPAVTASEGREGGDTFAPMEPVHEAVTRETREPSPPPAAAAPEPRRTRTKVWMAALGAVALIAVGLAFMVLRAPTPDIGVSDALLESLTEIAPEVEAPQVAEETASPPSEEAQTEVAAAPSEEALESPQAPPDSEPEPTEIEVAALAPESVVEAEAAPAEEESSTERWAREPAPGVREGGDAEAGSIEGLLAAAERDLEATRLTTPPGNNAFERYARILALDPERSEALRGLERIVERYVALSRRAASRERYEQAREYLDRAAEVLPDSALVRRELAAVDELEKAAEPEPAASEFAPSAEPDATPRLQPETLAAGRPEVKLGRLEKEPRVEAPEREPRGAVAAAETTPPSASGGEERSSGLAAAIAAAQRSPALSSPSKLAIFPFRTNKTCFFPREKELRSAISRLVANEGSLALAYSAYASDVAPLPDPGRLWLGDAVQKRPNVEWVYRTAERLEVDGVFMAWIKCSHSANFNDDRLPFELWLIDVERREVFHGRDELLHFDRGSRQVLAGYLAARR